MNTEDRELGWEDEIVEDSNTFTIAPAGDYAFEVVDMERARHTPRQDGKLPACNKAILKLRVQPPDSEPVDIKHNLFMHSRCESMIGEFFVGIGQKRRDEKLKPDWSRVIGARGRCKVAVRKWKSDRGEEMQSNEIKRFYDPPANGSAVPPAATIPPPPPAEQVDDTPF